MIELAWFPFFCVP